jgi:hypothetical protein
VRRRLVGWNMLEGQTYLKEKKTEISICTTYGTIVTHFERRTVYTTYGRSSRKANFHGSPGQ